MVEGKDWQERTKLLLGELRVMKLAKAHVVIIGLGGVGSYVVEGLARAGVGEFTLVDPEVIDRTNINRQIIANVNTIGQSKCKLCGDRIHSICPSTVVHERPIFYLPDTKPELDYKFYDYVIDAVDTITSKIHIIEEAKKYNVPVISAMGAGNKMDPTRFQVADIYETSVCPLARVMRQELRKRQIKDVKVVFSTEKAILTESEEIGSLSYVPSVMGLIIAGEVIQDISGRSD